MNKLRHKTWTISPWERSHLKIRKERDRQTDRHSEIFFYNEINRQKEISRSKKAVHIGDFIVVNTTPFAH